MEPYDPKDSYFKDFKPEKSVSRKIADTATKAINAIPESVKDTAEKVVKNAPKAARGAGQVGGAFGTGYLLGDLTDLGMEKATGYGMQDRFTDLASRALGQGQQYGEGASAVTAFDAIQQGVDRDIAMERFPISQDPNFDLLGAAQQFTPSETNQVQEQEEIPVGRLAEGLLNVTKGARDIYDKVYGGAVNLIGEGLELAPETAVYLFDPNQPTFGEIRSVTDPQQTTISAADLAPTVPTVPTAPGTTAPGATTPSMFPTGYDATGTKVDATGAPVTVPVTDQDRQDMRMTPMSPIERFTQILADLPPEVSQDQRTEIAARMLGNFLRIDKATQEAPMIGVRAASAKYGVDPSNIVSSPYGVTYPEMQDAPMQMPSSEITQGPRPTGAIDSTFTQPFRGVQQTIGEGRETPRREMARRDYKALAEAELGPNASQSMISARTLQLQNEAEQEQIDRELTRAAAQEQIRSSIAKRQPAEEDRDISAEKFDRMKSNINRVSELSTKFNKGEQLSAEEMKELRAFLVSEQFQPQGQMQYSPLYDAFGGVAQFQQAMNEGLKVVALDENESVAGDEKDPAGLF